MKDVQSQTDMRRIPLKHVGIKNLRWPVILKDKEQGEQHSVATISLAVDLPLPVCPITATNSPFSICRFTSCKAVFSKGVPFIYVNETCSKLIGIIPPSVLR